VQRRGICTTSFKRATNGIDASEEAIGDDSNAIWLNALRATHGVAQVAIHSQVAFNSRGLELSMSEARI
jgi:hypothetical protein